MRYSQQLDNEFKKLGFLNFKEFINTANTLNDKVYVLDDLYSDPEDIGFIFSIKADTTGNWQIQSINAAYQFETERTIEGVMVLGKTYSIENGELLGKEAIRKEILEMLRIEKIKERFYCAQNKGNTLYKWFRR